MLFTLLHEVARIILGHGDRVAIVDDSEGQPPVSPRHPRAVICRILPGEDIIEASEKVCLSEGIHGAVPASWAASSGRACIGQTASC